MLNMDLDEATLVALAKGGDVDAFNRLVLAHQDSVYGFAYRMLGNGADADDATQEAFVAAFEHIASLRGTAFRAWVMRIARNKCYDILRRGARRREVSTDDDESQFAETLPSGDASPSDQVLSKEMRDAIQHCIGSLGDDQRAVVVLVDVMRYSYDQAAETVGTSIGTVKSRLSRGRRRVRDCLRSVPGLLPDSFVEDDGNA